MKKKNSLPLKPNQGGWDRNCSTLEARGGSWGCEQGSPLPSPACRFPSLWAEVCASTSEKHLLSFSPLFLLPAFLMLQLGLSRIRAWGQEKPSCLLPIATFKHQAASVEVLCRPLTFSLHLLSPDPFPAPTCTSAAPQPPPQPPSPVFP